MIRTSPATIRRAAATLLAAVAFSFTAHHAHAQMFDLFAGSGTPASFTATTSTSGVAFGPGYTGATTVGVGANFSITQAFASNGSGSNTYTISDAGILGALSSTSAAKTFSTVSLSPNTTYSFTLTRTNTSAVGLLGSVTIQLASSNGTFVNTSTGTGLIGVVDVLGLFGSTGTTATFNFTTPANVSGPLTFTLGSNVTANALGGSYTFNSASINQVPEPTTVAASLIGMSGLVVLRMRRRLREV